MGYSVEHVTEIWDDETGDRWEVGPDRDGMDCIEIRAINREGKTEARMTFSPKLAALVAEALGDVSKGA